MEVQLKTRTELRKRSGAPAAGASSSTSRSSSALAERPSSFLETLAEVIPGDSPAQSALHGFWSQMPDAERALLANPSSQNLSRYQDLVRMIAKTTLSHNVQVDRRQYKTRGGGAIVESSTIRILDERLHKMALLMQSPDNSAFSLMRDLAEIRGMLMDLRR